MLQLTPQSRIFAGDGARRFPQRDRWAGRRVSPRARRQSAQWRALSSSGIAPGTTLKILCYDGQGFWLCTKRLSQGRFTWWPTTQDASSRLSARELLILLWNGNPQQAGMAEDWKKLG